MRYKMNRLCSALLVFTICIQSLVGCGSDTDKRSSSNVYVEESVIKEQTIAESTIDEKYICAVYPPSFPSLPFGSFSSVAQTTFAIFSTLLIFASTKSCVGLVICFCIV